MTRQCPECKRNLELNETNFRLSCDGYWRRKCRDCENAHKRKMYKSRKAKEVKKPNPHKNLREERLQAMIEKYDRVFKILDERGVSLDAPAGYVDEVLQRAVETGQKTA